MTQHGAYERWSEVIVYFRWLRLFCLECQLEIKKANRQWFFYSFFVVAVLALQARKKRVKAKKTNKK